MSFIKIIGILTMCAVGNILIKAWSYSKHGNTFLERNKHIGIFFSVAGFFLVVFSVYLTFSYKWYLTCLLCIVSISSISSSFNSLYSMRIKRFLKCYHSIKRKALIQNQIDEDSILKSSVDMYLKLKKCKPEIYDSIYDEVFFSESSFNESLSLKNVVRLLMLAEDTYHYKSFRKRGFFNPNAFVKIDDALRKNLPANFH